MVTGVGAGVAAAATGYLAGVSDAGSQCVWINAGIAGHPQLARGTLALVDRCTHRATGRIWYPSLPVSTALCRASCITVDSVESCYEEDALYEMECAGFMEAASRLATLDLVHAVKVVSDGPGHPASVIDRDMVSDLVRDAVPDIVGGLIIPLLERATAIAVDSAVPDISAWRERWHFTTSNAHRLREVIRDWQVVHRESPDPDGFGDCSGALDVIARLRAQVDAVSPRLGENPP